MYLVGLTGGTGSGKSTAARRFETHGIVIVDADVIGHGLIAPGGDAVEEVVATFGEEILSCGTIDRGRLGAIVFADPSALAKLNGIMKPRLYGAIAQACAAIAESGSSVAMVDAALLGDDGALAPWLEGLVLISASEERRVARLVSHRGMDLDTARQRVSAQYDPEKKRALAQWIIDNDESLDLLHERVDDVARALLSGERSQ